MSNPSTMPALITALNEAVAAMLAHPEVEPILMLDEGEGQYLKCDLYETGEDIDNADVIIVCPSCWRPTEILELDHGSMAYNETEAELQDDDLIMLNVSQSDRDRHTLAFVCRHADCHQAFDPSVTNNVNWS